MRRTVLALVIPCFLALSSCTGGHRELDPDTSKAELPGDVPDSATTDRPEVGAPDDSACPWILGYADPIMDDPDNGYQLELAYNGQRDMRALVTSCGTAVPDVDVTFAETEDPDNTCQLDLGSTPTGDTPNDLGVASVVVSSPQDTMDGVCRFKACISGTDTCITFAVHVEATVKSPLSVGFGAYEGTDSNISQGKVRLFRKDAPEAFRCNSLKANALPVATEGKGPVDLQTSVQFVTLPNLETDVTQSYTVFCIATQPGDATPRAQGCVDDVAVEFNAHRYIECPLVDIPPKIVGSYDMTTTLDMESGLPPTVASVVNFVIDFSNAPTEAILKLVCDPNLRATNDSALGPLCEAAFIDPAHPDLSGLTSIGLIMQQIMDDNLTALLKQQCPDKSNPDTCYSYTSTGVNDVIRRISLLSTMTCKNEPDADGLIALGGCSEKWHSVVVRWTLGKNCDPSDPTCGNVHLSLASLPGMSGLITADIEARLVEKNTRLAITRHALNLQYGALLDFVLEKILLPQVFGDGTDSLPSVDSFEALMSALMAGRACLVAGTCCHDFAANLVAQSGGAVEATLVETACDSLIPSGGTYIREFVTDLDTPTGGFTIGTPVADGTKYLTDQPCLITDIGNDMRFDALGGQSADMQCAWDASLTLGGFDYRPSATFYGNRQ